MSNETITLIVGLIASFSGVFVGNLWNTIRTNRKLKPLEKRADEQSQTMTVIQTKAETVAARLVELEGDKLLLEEARSARDHRITTLESELKQTNDHVASLEQSVKALTDEKAGLVVERDGLRSQLSRAEDEIRSLNIRVITLEAQLNAEKSVGERVVQPIVEALARLAAPAIAKVVELPPATSEGNAA